ncbi:MAG: TetR family transcriptional regulator [Rhodoglobus sp.]|nr:TetR family transcriptional regulator [Rhodoglobus sp.]
MTTADVADLGLRERKRLATRRAIQLAVIELVAERGLEGTTVDEVSRVADISPRTFFNYFASKEEALLGDQPVLPSDETVEQFVSGDGAILDDLARVLVGAGAKSMKDIEMVQLRHALLKQYPQLFAMRMLTMRNFEDQVGQIVARRLERSDPVLAANPEELAAKARLITLVAFAAMRHAWMRWATGEGTDTLSNRMIDSFEQLKGLFDTDAA